MALPSSPRQDRDRELPRLHICNSDGPDQDLEVKTETETFILGLMGSRPRPRLLNEVSRDRDFFETRHFRSHRYRDQYRDQESLGTETETGHLSY